MRLIDADALMRVYQEVLCPHVSCVDCSFLMDDGNCRFETMIREAPTIDAVPVVRCEKCVLHGNCTAEDAFVFAGIDNPFCCSGKWKEGADNE